MTLPPLPRAILRDDTYHGRKYCTLADAVEYGRACAAAERDNAIEIVMCELDNSGQAKAIIAAIRGQAT